MTRRALLLPCLVAFTAPAGATSGAAFLTGDPGARSAGMGSASGVLGFGAGSLLANPAASAYAPAAQVTASHADAPAGASLDFAGGVFPVRGNVLGAGLLRLGQSGFEGRDADRRPTGTFTASDTAALLTLSRRRGGVAVGAGFKALRQKISSEAAGGWALDAGAVWSSPGFPLRVGAALLNLGPAVGFTDEKEPLPLTIAAGAAWERNGLSFGLEARRRPHDGEAEVAMGTEYWAMEALALRTGYQTGTGDRRAADGDGFFGFGFGVGLRFSWGQVDYAFVPDRGLGASHRISLSRDF